MSEQTEREAMDAIASYERAPDEPYAGRGEVDWERLYAEPIEFLKDAIAALEDDHDPEDAMRCAREAIGRIEATL